MSFNNISNSLSFLNFFIDNLYETNFQSNGKFCKIHIRYNIGHKLVHHGSLDEVVDFKIYV